MCFFFGDASIFFQALFQCTFFSYSYSNDKCNLHWLCHTHLAFKPFYKSTIHLHSYTFPHLNCPASYFSHSHSLGCAFPSLCIVFICSAMFVLLSHFTYSHRTYVAPSYYNARAKSPIRWGLFNDMIEKMERQLLANKNEARKLYGVIKISAQQFCANCALGHFRPRYAVYASCICNIHAASTLNAIRQTKCSFNLKQMILNMFNG